MKSSARHSIKAGPDPICTFRTIYPQSETIDPQGPKSALSHARVERCEHRVLGDPGTQRWGWVALAVQEFLIEANLLGSSCQEPIPRPRRSSAAVRAFP